MQIDTTNFNMTISIVALFAVALIWWDIKQSFNNQAVILHPMRPQ